MIDMDAVAEELAKDIGVEEPSETYVVEKSNMFKIPWCIGDPNPLWRDEQYARQTRWGGLIACPQFIEHLRFRVMSSYTKRDKLRSVHPSLPGNPGNIVGGESVKYLRPIRPGDVLTCTRRIVGVKKRYSKKLQKDIVILSQGQTFTNQFGEVVATHESTSIKSG